MITLAVCVVFSVAGALVFGSALSLKVIRQYE